MVMTMLASVRAMVLAVVVPPVAVLLAVAAARGVNALARAHFAPLIMLHVPAALARRRKHGGRAAPEQREQELRVSLYRRNESGEEETAAVVECVFCLSGVEEGDEVRELRCRHIFHRGCLDRWLAHPHATCPLCRSRLLTTPPPPPPASPWPWDDDEVDQEEDSDSDSDMLLLMAAFVSSSSSSSWFWSPRP